MQNAKTQKIGDFFREYRLRSSLSPEAIAQELSLESAQLIYEYENGSRRIPLATVYAFANLYDIPADQVLELFYKLSEHAEDVDLERQRKQSC